jgi:hypothetical protein
MSPDEIRAGLQVAAALPPGRVKAERLESLAEQARTGGDRRLEAEVLLDLIRAYEYGAARDRMPVPMGRALQLLDRYPAEIGSMTYTIHWMLKWMAGSLIGNPGVPVALVNRWLDEFETRYREAGYSLRPVLDHRADLASFLGDHEAAASMVKAAAAAPRDRMADCHACERNGWGEIYADRGDDEDALEQWQPVLDGQLRCLEEPHRVLAKALLPMLRLSRANDARSAFLRGHSLVRGAVNLRREAGSLIEFCALTGNEPRGLEILTEHAAWIDDDQIAPIQRLFFITGVCVLLRRLTALGHGDLALGTRTVDETLSALDGEVTNLSARFDARNGTSAVGDGVRERLEREPLLDSLPLGAPARLPRPAARHAPPQRAAGAPTLTELIAEAERMADARDPRTGAAWERVAATGEQLPPDVTARIARSRAGSLAARAPAEAVAMLREVAETFDGLNDGAAALEARAAAAMAEGRDGDWAAAREAAAEAAAAAGEAFDAGGMTAREYLASRRAVPLLAWDELAARHSGDDPGQDVGAVVELVAAELALAEQLGERRYAGTYHEVLARLAGLRKDEDTARVHLNAARELFLETGEPWHAAAPAAYLAQLALKDGDVSRAEEMAREALAGGAGLLTPTGIAQLRSVVVEALTRQKGRELDLVDAALAAAASWDGIAEPDMLHATFIAARAYRAVGRHAEAAALFAEVMPRVDVPYGPREIALTRQQYADCLRKTGDNVEAAAQYLEALQFADGDPGWRARLAWSAAESLRHAGRAGESVAAYLRATDMLREVGDPVGAARCMRSVAWIRFGDGTDPDGRAEGVATMRAVLADLQARISGDDPADLVQELAATRKQLARMEQDGSNA